jgi:hypothetical protein
MLARDDQLCRGQADRRRIRVNAASHPPDGADITGARRGSQLLGQPTKLPDIHTLRENLLRHAIPFDRAPGPRLEA